MTKKTKNQDEKENNQDEIFGLTSNQVYEIRKRAKDAFFSKKKIWRQRGFWLVCTNAENRTAVWLGPDKIMVGEESDGTPILENK